MGGEEEALQKFLSRFAGKTLVIVSHQPPIQDALKLLGRPVKVEQGSLHHVSFAQEIDVYAHLPEVNKHGQFVLAI